MEQRSGYRAVTTLCQCGCGAPVKPPARFKPGHHIQFYRKAKQSKRPMPADEIERLTALNRERGLTNDESYQLEHAIYREEGRKLPAGLVRALARSGIKRRCAFRPTD